MTFIHNRAEVTDNVTLGKNCWVSAFAVVNANEGFIEIGDNCSVQESCVIHGKGVRIGNNVTIGHGAVIHGAKIGSNVIVGIHATVLDGAEIGDNCINFLCRRPFERINHYEKLHKVFIYRRGCGLQYKDLASPDGFHYLNSCFHIWEAVNDNLPEREFCVL